MPWIVFSVVLAVTAILFVHRWNRIADDRDLIRSLATEAFVDEVDDVASRIDLEQQKLTFLLEGIAATTAGEPDTGIQAALAGHVTANPLADRVPAVELVAVVEAAGTAALAAVAGDGSARAEALAVDLGLGGLVAEALGSGEPRVAGFTSDLGTGFALAAPVSGDPTRAVVLTFDPARFLTPALAGGGDAAALLVPPPPAAPIAAAAVAVDSIPPADGTLSTDGDRLSWSGPVEVFGQEWGLFVQSAPDLLRVPDSNELLLIGVLGVLVAVVILFVMRQRQRRVEEEAEVARRIQLSNRRFSTGFENAPVGMAILDASGRVIRANATMAEQLGYEPDELLSVRLRDLVHPDDQDEQRRHAAALSRGERSSVQSDLRYLRSDGRVASASQSISALNRRTDPERQFLVQSLDTTQRRAVEDELRHRALHDELTGLPNRTNLLEQTREALRESRDTGIGTSLLFIDLDRFKIVNDSLGHSSGDEVIQILADRLRVVTQPGHVLARFGGDEFVMLCPGVTSRDLLSDMAAVIHREVSRGIQLDDDNAVHVAASIGIAISGPNDAAETLLRDADAAMYRAKQLGQSRTEFFEAGIREAALTRLDLEQRLREAIERDEFGVHYQPVVDLRTGHVVGFEALLRWHHPELGDLAPGEFLGVADEAGLLDDIDRLTLGRACRQFATWSEQSPVAARWHLAVNCSSRWFHDGVVTDILLDLLSQSSLDPSRLWLEVTETALLRDTLATAASFDDLHDLGVKIAIDDFGTGFSSLSYLSRFQVDRLKIDRSFVQSLGSSRADNAIVAAVVEMAGALGISSVAEGTESADQLRILRDLGADFAQGFLLSRPLPAAQVEAALIEAG